MVRVGRSVVLVWFLALSFLHAQGGGLHPDSLTDTTIVWDHSWHAGSGESWVSGPVGGWPKNRGVLLVRVAYGHGVHAFTQLVSGHKRLPTKAKDYITDVDVLEKFAAEAHSAPSWSFCAQGQGAVRVQVLWCPTKKDAERHEKRHDYDSEFLPSLAGIAPPVATPFDGPAGGAHSPSPLYDQHRHQIQVIWDQSWNASDPFEWYSGPARSWDPHRGVLLLRCAGTPHLRGFVWRAGNGGQPRQLSPGDHVVDANVLERGPANPLEAILGGGHQQEPFHFGLHGSGVGRIQVLWLPHRDIVQHHCALNPFTSGIPADPTPPTHHHPAPTTPIVGDPRTAHGFVPVTFSGTLQRQHDQGPLIQVDVYVQMEAWPRTIYGGARTDNSGNFTFSCAVPQDTPLVLRIPDHRGESSPKTFPTPDNTWRFDARF